MICAIVKLASDFLASVDFSLCNQEVSKFINQANESKAAHLATKDGGQLNILQKPAKGEDKSSSKKSNK